MKKVVMEKKFELIFYFIDVGTVIIFKRFKVLQNFNLYGENVYGIG